MIEIDICNLLKDPAQAKQSADKRQFIFSEIIFPDDQSRKPYHRRTSAKKSKNWRSLNAEISLSWVDSCPKDLLFCDLGSGPLTNEDVFKERKVVYVDGAAYSGVNIVTDFRDPLPFKDQVFDRVHCSNVLEHLENPSLALQEINRILCPGGGH